MKSLILALLTLPAGCAGVALADIIVNPAPITPAAITVQPATITPPPIIAQPAAVVPAPITVTTAQEIANLQSLGYTVTLTPPPPVVPTPSAIAWPFTGLVSFPASAKAVTSYSVQGVGSASFMSGAGTHSPIMVQGVNGSWGGGSMAFTVTAHNADGTTSAIGTTNAITLQATNGTIVPTSPNMYAAGMFFGKGDFNNNVSADYAFTDPLASASVIALTSQNNVGMIYQPYFPVTSAKGYDTTKWTYLSITLRQTIAGHSYLAYFMSNGDVADGVSVSLGAPCALGTYCTYKVPLASFKLTNPQILKYAIVDNVNVPTGSQTFVSDMHFTN